MHTYCGLLHNNALPLVKSVEDRTCNFHYLRSDGERRSEMTNKGGCFEKSRLYLARNNIVVRANAIKINIIIQPTTLEYSIIDYRGINTRIFKPI